MTNYTGDQVNPSVGVPSNLKGLKPSPLTDNPDRGLMGLQASIPRSTAGVAGPGSSNVSAVNKPSAPAKHVSNPVAGRTPEPRNTTIKKGNLYYTYNSQGKNTQITDGKGHSAGTADTPGFQYGAGTQ